MLLNLPCASFHARVVPTRLCREVLHPLFPTGSVTKAVLLCLVTMLIVPREWRAFPFPSCRPVLMAH